MLAGFACQPITPPLGTRMMGFMNRDAARGCIEVQDDLSLRALYLTEQHEQVLIVGLDVCFLSRAISDRIKAAICDQVGIQPHQVLLNCSHTHNGPATSDWGAGSFRPPESAYLDQLIHQAVQAASQAKQAARPARMQATESKTTIPISRRLLDEGRMRNAPNPDGVVYDVLPVWVLRAADDDELICLVFSISAHPSALASHLISAEYPGAARRLLEDRYSRDCTLFLQGTAGDLKTSQGRISEQQWAWWTERNEDYLHATGDHLAKEVLAAIGAGLQEIAGGLSCVLRELQLPLLPIPSKGELKRAGAVQVDTSDPFEDQFPILWAKQQVDILDRGGSLPSQAGVLIQMISIGAELRIIAIEGEPVAELGWLIHDQFDQGITFALGYSNGDALYLPCDRMLPEGGYEVESYREYGYPSRLAPGIDTSIEQTLRSMIDESESLISGSAPVRRSNQT